MHLVVRGWVELEYGAGGVLERGVEGGEEADETLLWGVGGGVCVEEPLDD